MVLTCKIPAVIAFCRAVCLGIAQVTFVQAVSATFPTTIFACISPSLAFTRNAFSHAMEQSITYKDRKQKIVLSFMPVLREIDA